ncbi:MAG: hypothetical protein ACLUS6_16420 [Dysosmobacter sp.]
MWRCSWCWARPACSAAACWTLLTQGLSFFAACLPIMLGGWLSAIFQGRVAAASINIVAKHPEAATKGIIYCGIVEFYAILSLVATIMISLNIMK